MPRKTSQSVSGACPKCTDTLLLRTAIILLLLLPLHGCQLISNMMPAKREAQRQTQMRRDLQLQVMRVADEYVGQASDALDRVKSELPSPADRLLVQNWKLQQATAAYTAASGPNPIINALDLVVVASLSRMVLEDDWVQDRYGAKAAPVQRAYKNIEAETWTLLDGVLSPAQKQQLRQMLEQWRVEHPHVRVVAYVHFADFAHALGEPKPGEEEESGNLFSLLGLDPLSSLDPAVRELGQSRELAERSIYYFQRTPTLLDMQVERLSYELAAMPETKGMLEDADRMSLLGTAADRLSREIPIVLARERHALVNEVMQDLTSQTASVGKLTVQLQDALRAATDAATAADKALATFARVRQMLTPPADGKPDNSPPFDIRQYTDALREATATAQQLNLLVERGEPIAVALKANADGLTASMYGLLNRAFLLLLVLVVATVLMSVSGALVYRRLSAAGHAPVS